MITDQDNPEIISGDGIYGLPDSAEESKIHIIPVPWDVTVSYGHGTSNGPQSIFNASFQVDLFKQFFPSFWKSGIYMSPIPEKIKELGGYLRSEAYDIIHNPDNIKETEASFLKKIEDVNSGCVQMNTYVYNEALKILNKQKIPIVLGGDHSVPLGFLKALSETYDNFGILHIDAHADLRKAYQGFTFSHASVMYNAAQLSGISSIVQLGIRDYCWEEDRYITNSQNRIVCFTDRYIQHELMEGRSWQELCAQIIDSLPAKIYVSYDIDGLDPRFCPNTGTPVPGGLTTEQVNYLLECICESGRRIIGADLCEVSPHADKNNEWDANVGARVLLDICMYVLYSNNR